MMAGMKMAETMMDKMDSIKGGTATPPMPVAEAAVADFWACSCGEKHNTGKFCMNCGAPKAQTWDCACGHKGNRGKFCEECGSPKPMSDTWDCACGQKKNTGKCCPECGAKRQ